MTDRSPPMKPEMIEAFQQEYNRLAVKANWIDAGSVPDDEACRLLLSAALSVPAAAVVGEPVAWYREGFTFNFSLGSKRPKNNTSNPDEWKPLYAAPSAPEGWQTIETAPKDGTEILAYGYARCDGSRYANGQHIAWWDAELGWTGRDPDDRVTLHPSHWRPLPAPPALGGKP